MWPWERKSISVEGVKVRLRYLDYRTPMAALPIDASPEEVKYVESWFKNIRRSVWSEREPTIGNQH